MKQYQYLVKVKSGYDLSVVWPGGGHGYALQYEYRMLINEHDE